MAASKGCVDIVKCLVENGAEVNAVDKARIDMYNITYSLHVVIVLYSFQNNLYIYNKTEIRYLYYVCAGFCRVALIVT